jgi:hypothetical protein
VARAALAAPHRVAMADALLWERSSPVEGGAARVDPVSLNESRRSQS